MWSWINAQFPPIYPSALGGRKGIWGSTQRSSSYDPRISKAPGDVPANQSQFHISRRSQLAKCRTGMNWHVEILWRIVWSGLFTGQDRDVGIFFMVIGIYLCRSTQVRLSCCVLAYSESIPNRSPHWSYFCLVWFPWWPRHGAIDRSEKTLFGVNVHNRTSEIKFLI